MSKFGFFAAKNKVQLDLEDQRIDMPAVNRRIAVCSIIRSVNYVGKLPNISTLRQMVGLHAQTTVFYTVKWTYASIFIKFHFCEGWVCSFANYN